MPTVGKCWVCTLLVDTSHAFQRSEKGLAHRQCLDDLLVQQFDGDATP
jgi:hypothetical protein